jgi:hypothetical protein
MAEAKGVLALPRRSANPGPAISREPVREPAAGYGRRPAATQAEKRAAQILAWPALMQAGWLRQCHGKEKVYGSIP